MVETLTESFCERCGTRYEFDAPTRLNPLRKTRGLIGGLRNYLTSQDALGDAIGDAMRGEEEGLASAQLEAFHRSFNFCIDCRQYTCVGCWNDAAGRCRSCAPVAGADDLLERMQASAGQAVAEPASDLLAIDLQGRLGLEAWPQADLEASGVNGHGPAWPTEELAAGVTAPPEAPADAPDEIPAEAEPADVQAEPEPLERPLAVEAEQEPEPLLAAEAEPQPIPEPESPLAEAEPERELVAAEPEPELVAAALDSDPFGPEIEPETAEPEPVPLRVVAWDDDVDIPEAAAAEAEPEPEAVAAEADPEPEPVAAEAEPEPVVEPEPKAPRRPITPISETILRIPTRPAAPGAEPPSVPQEEAPKVAAQAEDPQLAARRAQFDLLGLDDPGVAPVEPERAKVLPYRSRGASVTPAEQAALAAAGQPVTFWEASAREVAGAPSHIGVQNCGACGLSLSATARFCRRCGTRQARSA